MDNSHNGYNGKSLKTDRIPQIAKLIFAIGIFSIVMAMLTGCYNQQKATQQTARALDKFPAVAADLIRKYFPCVTTSSDSTEYKKSISRLDSILKAKDTVITESQARLDQVRDSLNNVLLQPKDTTINDCQEECAAVVNYASKLYVKNENLLLQLANKNRVIDQLQKEIVNIRPVKDRVKDSADNFLCEKEKREKDDRISRLEDDLEEMTESRDHFKALARKFRWILIALAGAAVGITVFKLRKKLPF